MDIEQLVCFKKVAELEHMTKAAQELYTSQTRLSRTIADIERELGVKLFDRVGRGIKLNDAGRAFYQYAVKIIGDYDDAVTKVRQVGQKNLYQIALATNVPTYMPTLLGTIAKEYPQLKVSQTTVPQKNLLAMLRDHSVDFAVTAPPLREADMETLVVHVEQPAVIYYEGHWLSGHETTKLAALQEERFVCTPVGYGIRDFMEHYSNKYGVSFSYPIETSEAVVQYVQHGLGIAFFPLSTTLKDEELARRHTKLEEDMPCPIGLSWRVGFSLGETEELFVEAFRDDFVKEYGALLDQTGYPSQD